VFSAAVDDFVTVPSSWFTAKAIIVNGIADYGDQTNWAENQSVIAGFVYGSGGCQ
jgi:hypothetical protein